MSEQGRQFYSGPVTTEGCIHPKDTKAVAFGYIGVSVTAWLVTCLKNEFHSQKMLGVVVHTRNREAEPGGMPRVCNLPSLDYLVSLRSDREPIFVFLKKVPST